MPQTDTVDVSLAPGGEKKHSRVFASDSDNAVIKSVYIARPQSNGHTKARITIEWLD